MRMVVLRSISKWKMFSISSANCSSCRASQAHGLCDEGKGMNILGACIFPPNCGPHDFFMARNRMKRCFQGFLQICRPDGKIRYNRPSFMKIHPEIVYTRSYHFSSTEPPTINMRISRCAVGRILQKY